MKKNKPKKQFPERLPDFDDFVHPLYAHMQTNGLTIRDIADHLEISRGYAQQILHRWRAPSRDLILKIVNEFKIPAQNLLDVPLRDTREKSDRQ